MKYSTVVILTNRNNADPIKEAPMIVDLFLDHR